MAGSNGILVRLVSSAGQTSLIIFLGFVCRSLKIFREPDLKGLNKFLANIALPAEFFFSLATLDWSMVSFPLLFSLCVGKTIVYLLTSIVAYCATHAPDRIGVSGLFAIFTTKSNDIAMGVPIVSAIWGPEYASYLYLFSPYQLLVINLIGFVQMEVNIEKMEAMKRYGRTREEDDSGAAELVSGQVSQTQRKPSRVLNGVGQGCVKRSRSRHANAKTSSDIGEVISGSGSVITKYSGRGAAEKALGCSLEEDTDKIETEKMEAKLQVKESSSLPVDAVAHDSGSNDNGKHPKLKRKVGRECSSGSTEHDIATSNRNEHDENDDMSKDHDATNPAGFNDGYGSNEESFDQMATPSQIAYKIFKNLFSSPIIISCILGFVLNLAVGHDNFPDFVLEVLDTLSKTYSGAALFALGLSIKAELKAGQALLITALCGTKVVLLPIVMALTARVLTNNETDLQFAFLYGMLPTAPTVYIFAVNYQLKETLMSSSCLICLLASLPMILVAGVAIQIHGEKSEENSNRYGLVTAEWCASMSIIGSILLLLLAYLARRRRPVRGCWRVFMTLSSVTACSGVLQILCIHLGKGGKDVGSSESIALALVSKFFNYVQRSYGVLLAVVLYSRLRDRTYTYMLRMEKLGHICVWSGCGILILLGGAISQFRPEHAYLNVRAVGYQHFILSGQTETPLAFQVIELVVQLLLTFLSLYFIIKYQIFLKQECRHDGVAFCLPSPQPEEKGVMLQSEMSGYVYRALSGGSRGDGARVDASDDGDEIPREEGDAKFGDRGSSRQISGPMASSASELRSPGERAERGGHGEMEESCTDSTRYTLAIMLNSSGLMLAALMTLSRIFHMDETARGFTQVIFILDLTLHLSLGVLLCAIFITHRDMKWGLRNFYSFLIRKFPCIERFRSWAVGEVYLPDDINDLYSPNNDLSTASYRKTSFRRSSRSRGASHDRRYVYPRRDELYAFESNRNPNGAKFAETKSGIPPGSDGDVGAPYMSIHRERGKRSQGDQKHSRYTRSVAKAVAQPLYSRTSGARDAANSNAKAFSVPEYHRLGEASRVRHRSVPGAHNPRHSRRIGRSMGTPRLLVRNPFGGSKVGLL
mmetsp:Transcript_1547/g.2170  ORF Transcript_1547/g.2170 Transcript_1547/m.2170 type:complete len:1100 (-) Transcript_1547:150-3449(-)